MNTNVLYTSLPLRPMQVNSMLDLTSSDFFVFSVAIMYSISSCFHNFQCSLMLLLKLSTCGGLNLSTSDWLSLLNLNFYFWHYVEISGCGPGFKSHFWYHVEIFSGLPNRAISLRAIVECFWCNSDTTLILGKIYRWLIMDNKLW